VVYRAFRRATGVLDDALREDMLQPATMPASSRTFTGESLLQISMPMGGIGAGCICLAGHGALQDFSIRNRPSVTALPDDIQFWNDGGFALLHVRGNEPVTRLLEGPLPPGKIYDQALQASGYRKVGYEGLPRMDRCRFAAAYPTGQVELSDDAVPLAVTLTGWSPFIPLDDRTSSMPAAILEYSLTNTSNQPVQFDFSYHLSHLPRAQGGWRNTRNRAIDGGILFYNTVPAHDEMFGTATLTVIGHDPIVKAMWTRGGWFDWIAALWEEVSHGNFRPNPGNTDRDIDGRNGGSLLVPASLAPSQSITIPILITWHVPNVYLTQLQPGATPWWTAQPTSNVPPGAGPAWRPYYTSQWPDAAAVAADLRKNFDTTRARTFAFRDALFHSSLPPEAIDAIASNLAILKSPTLLREENGNLWGWEGCFPTAGCCPGSCTHVWNYAQALPHLFPALERTLREQELERSMEPTGHVNFRSALPDGPPDKTGAAADGQLGGIMKLYRDWHISGDSAWLQRLLPRARCSLDYCIKTWDPDRRGALFEPHHNTYDIEFWGPDGMCTSIYVGALCAMAEMTSSTGSHDDAAAYADLATKAAAYCDQHLYNGQYYQQQVMWHELKDSSFTQRLDRDSRPAANVDPALLAVLKSEGPPYQYGAGCLSDGVIGQWMASLYGIDTPLDAQHVRSTLAAIFRHNFRADLSAHFCTQRPGYAIGHEPGLILCTWPNDGRPTLPFVYSDEVWTGIEYQVASHLITVGMVDQGMALVKAVRSRYAGHARNPFNEYECGSYYARAMSSFALLQALSGFRYSQLTRTLCFAPKLSTRPWRSFFATATGWGTIKLEPTLLQIELIEGNLALDQLILGQGPQRQTTRVRATATAANPLQIELTNFPTPSE
jgi:uncharacterized protein (DUF608 family)